MAETTADVRRDIEMTRERMSRTLAQLEQKVHVTQIVKDHPWPALAVAFGAGILLAGSRADVKAAAATVTATRGASGRVGEVLDDVVASLVGGVTAAFHHKIDSLVSELKGAIGAPATTTSRSFASSGDESPRPRYESASSDSFGTGTEASGAEWRRAD